MMPLRDRERRARVRRQARRLATAGRHIDWRSIQSAMTAKGEMRGVKRALASWLIRLELNLRCALAQLTCPAQTP